MKSRKFIGSGVPLLNLQLYYRSKNIQLSPLRPSLLALQRVVALLPGPHLHHVSHIIHENLSVPDTAGVEHTFGRIDHVPNRDLADHDLQLDFGQQRHLLDFDAPIIVGVALLSSAPIT